MFLKLQYQISSNASERKLLARNVTASDVLGSIRGGATRVLGEQGDGIVLSSRQPITYDYVTVDRKLFESVAGQGFFDGICRTVERFELDYIFKNAMIRGNGFENPDVKDLIRFINGFNKLTGQGSVSSSTQVYLSRESSMFHEGNSLSALMQRLKQKRPSAEFVRM